MKLKKGAALAGAAGGGAVSSLLSENFAALSVPQNTIENQDVFETRKMETFYLLFNLDHDESEVVTYFEHSQGHPPAEIFRTGGGWVLGPATR